MARDSGAWVIRLPERGVSSRPAASHVGARPTASHASSGSAASHAGKGPKTPVRVAIKDLIDMEGLPTTAGCEAIARIAGPAPADAACLAGIRHAEAAGEAVIVGKVTLHELAFGITGINRWAGTPINPLDPAVVPGGSSSGSAVVVGDGEADVALGSDSGGSVRIPAACCGVAGLKTTFGRIPIEGVWPLAPSLDTVGVLAAGVEGLITGMHLLEPGFASTETPKGATPKIARFRPRANPDIDQAIDTALADAGFEVIQVDVPGWEAAGEAATTVLVSEARSTNGHLLDSGLLGQDVTDRLRLGREITDEQLATARKVGVEWISELDALFGRFDALALPTLVNFPPRLENADKLGSIRATLPVNLAGVPAVSLPVPAPRNHLPASLQLVGPADSEAVLLRLARQVEANTQ